MEFSFTFKVSDNVVNRTTRILEQNSLKPKPNCTRRGRGRGKGRGRPIISEEPEVFVCNRGQQANSHIDALLECPITQECFVFQKHPDEGCLPTTQPRDEPQVGLLESYMDMFRSLELDHTSKMLWLAMGHHLVLSLLENLCIEVETLHNYSMLLPFLSSAYPLMEPVARGVNMYIASRNKPSVGGCDHIVPVTDCSKPVSDELKSDGEDKNHSLTEEETVSNDDAVLDDALNEVLKTQELEGLNTPVIKDLAKSLFSSFSEGDGKPDDEGRYKIKIDFSPEGILKMTSNLSGALSSLDAGSLDVPKPCEDFEV